MPHKHKRRQKDENTYDLPPSRIAKSLAVRDPHAKAAAANNWKGKNKNKNRKDAKPTQAQIKANSKLESRPKSTLEDDTPKAFRRLMQFHQSKTNPQPDEPVNTNTKKNNNNNKSNSNKKRKRDAGDTTTGAAVPTTKKKTPNPTPKSTEEQPAKKPTSDLKILPGEKLSDFAARVDRSMPLSAMKRSDKSGSSSDPNMPKLREERQTKHERHLRRLQRMWREEEKQIQEREAAEREEREEGMEEQLNLWKAWETEAGRAKAKKKGNSNHGKGKKGNGDAAARDDDPDPWAKLNKKERANRPENPFDVAQAPPELKKPRELFKVRGGARVDVANVPNAVGSLRRREELASERKNIVEEYRRLMAERRQ